MKNLVSLLSILFIAPLLCSCKIKELEFKELKDVKLTKTSKDLIEVEITVVIKNPNWFGFRVKDNNLDLYMNHNRIGKAQLVKGFRVEGKSEKAYHFKVRAVPDINSLVGNAYAMITSFTIKKQSLGIKGDLRVSIFGIGTNYKVDLTQYLN